MARRDFLWLMGRHRGRMCVSCSLLCTSPLFSAGPTLLKEPVLRAAFLHCSVARRMYTTRHDSSELLLLAGFSFVDAAISLILIVRLEQGL